MFACEFRVTLSVHNKHGKFKQTHQTNICPPRYHIDLTKRLKKAYILLAFKNRDSDSESMGGVVGNGGGSKGAANAHRGE